SSCSYSTWPRPTSTRRFATTSRPPPGCGTGRPCCACTSVIRTATAGGGTASPGAFLLNHRISDTLTSGPPPAARRAGSATTCGVAPLPGHDLSWALQRAEAEAKRRPQFDNGLQTLGLVLYRAGKYESALHVLEHERQFRTPSRSCLPVLAMTYHQLRRPA